MDIIQPDLRRCGGFTEGRKISALAQAAGITVIPHAYGATHIHFALADAAIPMIEYFPLPIWDELPILKFKRSLSANPNRRTAESQSIHFRVSA